jgi:pseudouridine-5'-phosphate glycosidase
MNKSGIMLSPEVEKAIEQNKPVVALESTIISHGMPYPENVKTAINTEEIIRENGAIPATVAVVDGVPTVGISKEHIEYLGKHGPQVEKVSKRDIPIVAARRQYGATTVAATAFFAAKVGVRVFATGGIGGVHRYSEETMDISSDLEELAVSNIAVVCAGAKSILDLRKTIEYLETKGITILGYQTQNFPAFFTRDSGLELKYRVDDVKIIARILKSRWDLNIHGSVIVANPIPKEFDMHGEVINRYIEEACKAAYDQDKTINGSLVTPFILEKIKELTKGKSLEANIGLMYNNAKLATEIAKEYARAE